MQSATKPQARPSTASRSRTIGTYAALNSICEEQFGSTESDTMRDLEILCCVQQLDNSLCTLQRVDGLVTNEHNAKREEILLRRTKQQENYFARKMELLMMGEKKRARATFTQGHRPEESKQMKMALEASILVHLVLRSTWFADRLKESKAKRTLKAVFYNHIIRFLTHRRQRSQRKRWVEINTKSMVRPSAEKIVHAISILRHVPVSVVDSLAKKMEPRCFKKGEYAAFTLPQQDARSRSILVITSGSITCYFDTERNQSTKKERTTQQYTEGKAVGIEAVLGADKRKFIAVCDVDTCAWHLPAGLLQDALQIESDDSDSTHLLLDELAKEKRKEMLRLQPVTDLMMRSSSKFFAEWAQPALLRAAKLFEPKVVLKGEELPRGIILLVNGKIEIVRKESKRSIHSPLAAFEHVKPGQCFGELQSYFPDEDRRWKLVALTPCDFWFLPRSDFLEIATHENVATLMPLVAELRSQEMKDTSATVHGRRL